jgi:hypothetical protein
MTWLLLAIIACITVCAAIEITRRSRIDPYEMLLYRCMISGFVLLPFFQYMTWPHGMGFYVMAGLNAIIYAWGNIVMGNLAARRNGRVAMMFQPLMIFGTYIVWVILHPQELATLQTEPQHATMTIACFLLLVGSLYFIRRNDYAWSSLIAILPVGLGFALLNIGQKWFLTTPDGGIGMILAILIIGNFGQVLVLPFLRQFRVPQGGASLKDLPRFPLFLVTSVAVLHLISWGTLMYAMQIAVNPAYPVAIMALAPVVFQTYYWIRGWKDHSSPVAGAAMTLGALMLGLINA